MSKPDGGPAQAELHRQLESVIEDCHAYAELAGKMQDERDVANAQIKTLKVLLIEARHHLRKYRSGWNGPIFQAVWAINKALSESPPEDRPGAMIAHEAGESDAPAG